MNLPPTDPPPILTAASDTPRLPNLAHLFAVNPFCDLLYCDAVVVRGRAAHWLPAEQRRLLLPTNFQGQQRVIQPILRTGSANFDGREINNKDFAILSQATRPLGELCTDGVTPTLT